MNYKAIYSICFSWSLLLPTKASAIEICGTPAQGEILVITAPEAEKLLWNQKEYAKTEDGKFIIAFGRDEKPAQTLQLLNADRQITELPLGIAPTKWDIQKINGVPQQKVTPSNADKKEIERERKSVRKALTAMSADPYWEKGFIRPVKGRISGNFGGQRVMNGTPLSPHQGMDIAAPAGTPVKASADGIVTLSGGNYFYSGNMVIIDHGHNLSTMYAHLKSAKAKVGDRVKQGDVIGYVGATGRATGPHLHWGASLNGIRFQPASLLKINDKKLCRNL